MESYILFGLSLIVSIVVSYIGIMRKTDTLETKMNYIEKRLDNLEAVKMEEHLATFEARLNSLEQFFQEIKQDLREIKNKLT